MYQQQGLSGFRTQLSLIARRGGQVWRLVPARHKWTLSGATLLMAVISVSGTVIAVLLGMVVDAATRFIEHGGDPADAYRSAAGLLGWIGGVYLLKEILQIARRYLVGNACMRLESDTTVGLVSHMMKAEAATLARDAIGALNGRIHRSVAGFVRFVRVTFLDLLPTLLTGITALSVAVGKQPVLGLVMAGVIPLSILLTVWQLISQTGARLRLIRATEALDGMVVERMANVDYIRAADMHRREVERVRLVTENRRTLEVHHHFAMSLFGSAKAVNEAFFHLLVLGVAVHFALCGVISVGDILVFSLLFLNVMAPLSEVHRVIDEGHESSLQVGDLLSMLAEREDLSYNPPSVREPELAKGRPAIEIENLRCGYASVDGKRTETLDGVSISIRHGETIGVAGRSGCGKTTLLRVLLRLVHPSSGTVLIGGVPIGSVSRESIGRLIGYVGQSPFIVSGTIAENISYGIDGAAAGDIRRAAELACIHDEILRMPGQYQAAVSERGSNLSGGQLQRLALARIILKNPPILILDEATSALDNISERLVQQAIDAASAHRTVIMVAHRLSTLAAADRILVLQHGRGAECGGFQELVQRGGAFAELVRAPGSGAELPTTAAQPAVLSPASAVQVAG